jgi:predicted SprT family Zn-dependent metalloprotease
MPQIAQTLPRKRRHRPRSSSRLEVTAEIREWIEFACNSCECRELAEEIECSFNGRLRRYVGVAWTVLTNGVPQEPRIELSSYHWKRLNEVGQRNTVIHEACHIVCAWTFGQQELPHSAYWKWLMRRCDTEPDVAVQECEVKEQFRWSSRHVEPGLVVARCGCTGHRKIRIIQARLIRAGETFACDVCRQQIRLIYR